MINYKKIKDICEIRKGKKVLEIEKKSDDSIRYIQIDDLRNNNNIKYCSPESSYIYVNKEDLIIAWDGANAGTIGYNLEGAIGSTLAKIKVIDNNVFAPFLALYLQSKFEYFQRTSTGATIPHISRGALENLDVPVFSLEQQKQVYFFLLKTKELLKKRESQITALDELTQSLFLEMFGDPVVNPLELPTERLGETGELKRGMSKHRPRNAPELLGGPYPLIQTGDVSRAGLFIETYKSTYSELGLKQSKMWESGTLCITIAANIAETSILKFDACFPDSVVGYRPYEKMNTIFVHYWFSFFQKIIERNAPESAQKNINLKILNDLQIIQPSIELQNEFAQKVLKINKQRSLLIEAHKSLETLYNSLIQKAFKGEMF